MKITDVRFDPELFKTAEQMDDKYNFWAFGPGKENYSHDYIRPYIMPDENEEVDTSTDHPYNSCRN